MEWAIAGMVSVVAGLVGPGLSSFDTPVDVLRGNGFGGVWGMSICASGRVCVS